MNSYISNLAGASRSLTLFRNSAQDLPRMTTKFNRARKRVVAVLDDLLAQFRIAENQSQDVEDLLERLE